MKYLFALLLTLASFGSAFADSQDTTLVNVPFDFVIGDNNFSAGAYSISRISQDASALRIQSKDGKTTVLFKPIAAGTSDPNGEIRLQFRHEGDKYFLTEIFGGLETYIVAPASHRQRMANPDETVVTTTP